MHFNHRFMKTGLVVLLLLSLFYTSVLSSYATEDSGGETAASEQGQESTPEEKKEETIQQEQTEEDNSEELKRLENERQETLDAISGLKDSISDVQKDIDSLKAEKTTIQSYINQLDRQMGSLSAKISDFEQKIDSKITDIESTKEALEEAKAACVEQYESMKMRIQYIYENPSESLIEMLFTADNLTDLLNRAGYVASMSDYDRNMMDKLNDTKAEIELKEKTLEAELEELKMMQDELEAQKKKVNASINSKKGELAAANSDLGDVTAQQGDYQKQLAEQERLLDEIEEQIARAANPDAYQGSSTGFIWPCPGYTRISSYFGPRPQPTPGASTNHKGVDLAAPYGTSILASAAGVVTTSTYSSSAGNYIVIAHGNGMSTVYMHCSSLLVSVGETVEQGQVIAKVGSTGYSTGNHLHFGVIKNGSYVNPLNYASP